MDFDLKSKLLGLTLGEILELGTNELKPKENPWARFTLGKLDSSIQAISNSSKIVIEYSINVPDGVLCNIKKIEDVESCIKEINMIIAKYQK